MKMQRSEEWFRSRRDAANSSEQLVRINAFGQRDKKLSMAVEERNEAPNFFMKWGTVLENISGYIFTHITGLEYEETGSIAWKSSERVRGSVDGYGKGVIDPDIGEESFILETKTPARKEVASELNDYGYYCQIIQNIEIIDADCGVFNNVKLLPATSYDLFEFDMAHMNEMNEQIQCQYNRYNLAKNAKAYAVASRVIPCKGNKALKMIEKITSKDADFNFADLIDYDRRGNFRPLAYLSVSDSLFNDIIDENHYTFEPFSICDNENTKEWAKTLKGHYLVFKVDAINIERVKRQKEFWHNKILPINRRWTEDLDRVKNNENPLGNEGLELTPVPDDASESIRLSINKLRFY